MKTKMFLVAVAFLVTATALAQDAKQRPAAKPLTKNTYYVASKHTPEQCMDIMTEMKKKGDTHLSKFYWGCMSGDHTAYAFLQGTAEDEVKKMLPKEVQETSTIIKVDKFTAAKIEQMHKDHKDKGKAEKQEKTQ